MNVDIDTPLDPLAAMAMRKLLAAGLSRTALEQIDRLDEVDLRVLVARLEALASADDVLDRVIDPGLGRDGRKYLAAIEGLAEGNIRTYRQLLASVDWTAARGKRSIHGFRGLGRKTVHVLVEHLIALRLLGEDARVVLRY